MKRRKIVIGALVVVIGLSVVLVVTAVVSFSFFRIFLVADRTTLPRKRHFRMGVMRFLRTCSVSRMFVV